MWPRSNRAKKGQKSNKNANLLLLGPVALFSFLFKHINQLFDVDLFPLTFHVYSPVVGLFNDYEGPYSLEHSEQTWVRNKKNIKNAILCMKYVRKSTLKHILRTHMGNPHILGHAIVQVHQLFKIRFQIKLSNKCLFVHSSVTFPLCPTQKEEKGWPKEI